MSCLRCSGWAATRTNMGNRLRKTALAKEKFTLLRPDCSLAYQLRQLQKGHVASVCRFDPSTRELSHEPLLLYAIVALLVAAAARHVVGLVVITTDKPEGR